MLGRKTSKKAKAPVPAFRQVVASAGMQFVLAESMRNTSSQTPILREPDRQTVIPSVEILVFPVVYLVDESSTGEKEAVPLKR